MNKWKNHGSCKLFKGLLRRGMKVSACKLISSICDRDLTELRATGAVDVRKFSDYGVPSTCLCPPDPSSITCGWVGPRCPLTTCELPAKPPLSSDLSIAWTRVYKRELIEVEADFPGANPADRSNPATDTASSQ